MTSTQAQIDAAVVAIAGVLVGEQARPLEQLLFADECERIARAALTAAAEVGELSQSERELNEEHYQAAMKMSEKHRRLWMGEYEKNQTLVAATIERCARIVETEGDPWSNDGRAIARIAATIRALATEGE
jgi:xanthosine utilization system XapX-like protein